MQLTTWPKHPAISSHLLILLRTVCGHQDQFLVNVDSATVPDTSYLRGSKGFRKFPAQVFVKVREDICSATTPLPRTTRMNSAEGFTTGLGTSDWVDSR